MHHAPRPALDDRIDEYVPDCNVWSCRLHHSHHGVGVENRVELQSEHEFFKTPEARNGHKYA